MPGQAEPWAELRAAGGPGEPGGQCRREGRGSRSSSVHHRQSARWLEVYRFWRNFENLPRFMDHLESVTVIDENRSHWVAKGTGRHQGGVGRRHPQRDRRRADRLALAARVRGRQRRLGALHPGRRRSGTEVRVVLSYDPPAGKLGAAVAKLLGEEPSQAGGGRSPAASSRSWTAGRDRRPRPGESTAEVTYDCIIVGAGPAGLSAALMLGRCRRSVLVCDAGEPRNARCPGDCTAISPGTASPRWSSSVWPGRSWSEYPTVEFHRGSSRRRSANLRWIHGRLRRRPPAQCPQAAAGHRRGGRTPGDRRSPAALRQQRSPLSLLRRLGVARSTARGLRARRGRLGAGSGAHRVEPTIWCSAPTAPADCHRAGRGAAGSAWVSRSGRIGSCGSRASDGWLERMVFAEGEPLPRRALFFCSGQHQRPTWPHRLGCRFNAKGAVDTGSCEATNVPGLYVAGDASKEAQFVIVAAAEGCRSRHGHQQGAAEGRPGSEEELDAQPHQAGWAVREERLSKVPGRCQVQREQLVPPCDVPIAIDVGIGAIAS